MTTFSHASYPTLIFIAAETLISSQYSLQDLLILIFFSIFPDLDFIFYKFIKKGSFNSNFQHHKWLTHWPIIYSPLLIALAFFPSFKLLLITYGIYSHLIMDTFLAGDGIMWLYPFSKKFFNLFAEKTTNNHGKDWFNIYKKMLIYKIDILAFVIVLLVILA